MQRCHYFVFLAACGLVLPVHAASPTEKANAARISSLVNKLGSDNFQDRRAAVQELELFGETALPALRQACVSEDLEVRHRAERLVKQIEQDVEARKLLAPRRVRLTFKDVPLPEAVAALKTKTGLDVRLDGDPARLSLRRVTLDTGDVTYWDALDQFCAKAGLVEDYEPQDLSGYGNRRQILLGQQIRVWRGNGTWTNTAAASKMVLREGTPTSLPTCATSAIRVRVLPAQSRTVVHSAIRMDAAYTLEVAAEPTLDLLQVYSPRLAHATDDKGMVLTAVTTLEESAVDQDTLVILSQAMGGQEQRRQVTLGLALREPAATSISELRGSVLVKLQAPPGPLATCNKVLNATGKTFSAEDGTSFKLKQVKQQGKQLELEVDVETPSAFGGGMRVAFAINGAMNQLEAPAIKEADTGLQLFDAKNRRIPATAATASQPLMNGVTSVNGYKLTYALEDGQQPTQLVLIGRRTVVLDVPFAFKDVPLPRR